MRLLIELRKRAARLKAESFALYLAARHPQTPWYAKLLVAAIVAYAFSPIDVIPDFVPILGYLDDLVLIPMGIGLAISMVPPHGPTPGSGRVQGQGARDRIKWQTGKPCCGGCYWGYLGNVGSIMHRVGLQDIPVYTYLAVASKHASTLNTPKRQVV